MWHEPFGLAIVESLYFGCPIIATPYGSLPELVPNEVGFLSDKKSELVSQLLDIQQFSHQKCHEYAVDNFSSKQMALAYLKLYEKILNHENLNPSKPKLVEQSPKYLPFVE